MVLRALLFVATLSALAGSVAAQDLAVVGLDGKAAVLSAADLAALPRARVDLDAHGERHRYEGPLLIEVLAKAGAPTGKALRGPAMANVVLVEARDGYAVALGLAEADPATRSNRIILADRRDGAALPADEGAYRLVIEGDLRPARSARMVNRLVVRRLGGGGDGLEKGPHAGDDGHPRAEREGDRS
ncbi:molybdopterin-binding oxidoreductase [Caulobacter sp. BP25]|uniref:molybdopterin-binding oxidoreductase n=1 Tax=Caulobacter sp. BP25 TaxID=2048900 RepID=UPI00191BAF15|nr:molybdopterin-binding oxidoreductase [Caulobacter sp. BP25]